MPTRIELPDDLKIRRIVFYQESSSGDEQELDIEFVHNGVGTYHCAKTESWESDEYSDIGLAKTINRIAAHDDGHYDMSAAMSDYKLQQIGFELMHDPEVIEGLMKARKEMKESTP
jgi:hypothetical protein